MKEYTVTIETSVLVTANDLHDDGPELTPELAKNIALGWLEESIENCNPYITVREGGTVVLSSHHMEE